MTKLWADKTQTGFTGIYAQSLSADCDIDLWPNSMVLVHDTWSFVPNYFQIPPSGFEINSSK